MNDILHTADIHIGSSKHILPNEYLERQTKMLYCIRDLIVERKIKVLAIVGYCFEKGTPLQEGKDLFVKWIAEVENYCKVILIIGNHDKASADKTALDTFVFLKDKLKNTTVVIQKRRLIYAPDTKSVVFGVIPWGYDPTETAQRLYDKLTKKPKRFIVLAHVALSGIPLDTGRMTPGDHKKFLKLKCVDAWLLGDIHKRFISPCGRIQMVGAPIQHNWGDKPPKGVSILSYKDINKPEFVELDVPKFEIVQTVKKAKAKAKTGTIVKLITNDVIEEELDDNIVEVANYLLEEEAIDYKSEFKVTEGLSAFLAEKGLDKKQQKFGIKVIEKMCDKL